MSQQQYLVSGAMGCIGAWVVRLLLDQGADVTTFDASTDDRRLRQLIDAPTLGGITRLCGDITDAGQVAAAADGKSHIVHLAAMQVPLVRAEPVRGAAVNVQGTVNVFEAAKQHRIHHLSFASSAAVYGHPSNYDHPILGADAARLPGTLYGVFKVANEDTAKVYWSESDVPSVGIRPYTVYGPGRDQGVTAAPTLALRAAVHGEPYHIPYGGTAGFNYARDVAQVFIDAAEATPHGAISYSMGGDIVSVADFVAVAAEVTGSQQITHGDDPLPFPAGLDDSALRDRLGRVAHTPLRNAIEETAEFFRTGRVAA